MNRGILYAVTAGLFAASSSVFGKLAMDPSVGLLDSLLCIAFKKNPFVQIVGGECDASSNAYFGNALLVLRVLCFVLNIVCTGAMWGQFVQALQRCSTTTATVINTGTNFFSTALFAFFVFGEPLSMKWWGGASLILTGLCLVVMGEQSADANAVASATITSKQKETTTTTTAAAAAAASAASTQKKKIKKVD